MRLDRTLLPMLLLAVIASGAPSCGRPRPAETAGHRNGNLPAAVAAQPGRTRGDSDVGFASRVKLVEHYEKHGREFGSIPLDEYLARAEALRDGPAGGDVLEAVRSDGVITRYDRATGEFIAFNPDRVIRTFFKPSDGEAYFRRQSRRGD